MHELYLSLRPNISFPLPPLLSHASSWPPLVPPALSSSPLSLSSVTKVPQGKTGSHQARGEAGAAGSAAFSARWGRMSLKSQTAGAHQFQPQCLVSPLSVGFGWTSLCTCSRKGHQRCSPPREAASQQAVYEDPQSPSIQTGLHGHPDVLRFLCIADCLGGLHLGHTERGVVPTQHGPRSLVLAPGQSHPVWPSDKHGHTRRCSLAWCHGAQNQENGDERQHHSTETSHAVQTPHSPSPTEKRKRLLFIYTDYIIIIL